MPLLKKTVVGEIKSLFGGEKNIGSVFDSKDLFGVDETCILYTPTKYQTIQRAFGRIDLMVSVSEKNGELGVFIDGIEIGSRAHPEYVRKTLKVYDKLRKFLSETDFKLDEATTQIRNRAYFKRKV